jgi:hypothetical protein
VKHHLKSLKHLEEVAEKATTTKAEANITRTMITTNTITRTMTTRTMVVVINAMMVVIEAMTEVEVSRERNSLKTKSFLKNKHLKSKM